jgi:hypothetical protein
MMKTIAALSVVAGATAFTSPAITKQVFQTSLNSLTIDELPGALAPVGFFDPLNLAENADPNTLRRYREAELTHGRVAMLAVIGFFAGEAVEGSSFLFDAQIKGPAITHFLQVPTEFWAALTLGIAALEWTRAEKLFVNPSDVPVDQPGQMLVDTIPGDMGFDPLNLSSDDSEEFFEMQTKELQNGRLAMLAAAGFLAQEAVNGKGIIETLQGLN